MSGVLDTLLDSRPREPVPPPSEEAISTRSASRFLFREWKVKRRGSGQPGGGQFARTATPDKPLTRPLSVTQLAGRRPKHAPPRPPARAVRGAAPNARPDEPPRRRSRERRVGRAEKLPPDVFKGGYATGEYITSSDERDRSKDELTQLVLTSKVSRDRDGEIAERLIAAHRDAKLPKPDVVVSPPPDPGEADRFGGVRGAVARHFRVPSAVPLREREDIPGYRRMTIAQRRAATRKLRLGRFAVASPGGVRGRRVLLVDDVVTSGEQAREMRAALTKAGARDVQFVALARANSAPEDSPGPRRLGAAPGARPDDSLKARRKLSSKELPGSVGRGTWSVAAERNVKALQNQDWPEDRADDGKLLDTEMLYRGARDSEPGYWPPERVDLHNRIARRLLEGAGEHDDPRAVFTAGGPASGKSSIADPESARAAVDTPRDSVMVNPDVVKEMLPEYQALKRAGDKRAAEKVHEESSHVAKLVGTLALARGLNVFTDGVGNSESGKFLRKVKAAQRAGHAVNVVYATIPSAEAIRRADERRERGTKRDKDGNIIEAGRAVAEGFIRSAHRDVTRRFIEDILPDASIPFEVWDNSGPEGSAPRRIGYRVTGGGLVTVDEKLWRAWMEKAAY